MDRYSQIAGKAPEATLVFDKGNISEDAMENLAVSDVHFVTALSSNRLVEVLQTPQDQFRDIPSMPGTKAFSTDVTLWGKHCQVVVAYTESFFTQQLSGVTQHMVKCQNKLFDLQKRLATWHNGKARGKKLTLKGVQREIKKILAPQFMNSLFKVEVLQKQGLPELNYSLDHSKLQELTEHRLGKTILLSAVSEKDGKFVEIGQELRGKKKGAPRVS